MNEDWFERIEEYLNGKMTAEDRLVFESEISKNKELASAVSIYRTVENDMRSDILHSGKEASLKASLQELNARYFNEFNKNETGSNPTRQSAKLRPLNGWKILALAAAVTGVIVLVFSLFN